jgi:tripartite-type tricarboxylate transporter receptor subunit TctC
MTALHKTLAPALAGLLLLALGAPPVSAQPAARPLKIVVPFPPGNGTDILARLMSPKMTAATGRAVIVENRGGANGMIGAEYVAHAAPDGATILFTSPSTHVTALFLSKNLPYDPVKDFAPGGNDGTSPHLSSEGEIIKCPP